MDYVSLAVLRTGMWEFRSPGEMLKRAGVVTPPHGRFLDIGTNVGWYSLMYAQAGWDVIAVEPMTRNRLALAVSLCLNPALRSRIATISAAMVASPEIAASTSCIVKANNYNYGNGKVSCSSGTKGAVCKKDGKCERVVAMTLDQVLAATPASRVDVAKLDVEGSECNVLQGGQSLFSPPRRVTVLQVEVNEARTQKCVEEVARRYHYRIVRSATGRSWNGRPRDSNWLLVDNRSSPVMF